MAGLRAAHCRLPANERPRGSPRAWNLSFELLFRSQKDCQRDSSAGEAKFMRSGEWPQVDRIILEEIDAELEAEAEKIDNEEMRDDA